MISSTKTIYTNFMIFAVFLMANRFLFVQEFKGDLITSQAVFWFGHINPLINIVTFVPLILMLLGIGIKLQKAHNFLNL